MKKETIAKSENPTTKTNHLQIIAQTQNNTQKNTRNGGVTKVWAKYYR